MNTAQPDPYGIRTATPADLPLVLHHRRQMFLEMGFDPPSVERTMILSEPFFAAAMQDREYFAWFVTTTATAAGSDETVVAGGGILLLRYQPGPRDALALRPYVVNVFTEVPHRGKGLARRLMNAMTDWGRAAGYSNLYLHASSAGRPLYESLGYEPTNEMRLKL